LRKWPAPGLIFIRRKQTDGGWASSPRITMTPDHLFQAHFMENSNT